MAAAGSHRRPSEPRLLHTVTTLVMVVMVFGAALAVASRVIGVRALVEHSDSMYPAIAAGDLVISQDITAQQATVGDVVTFPDPDHAGKTLTHRVVAVRQVGDIHVFDTRGDANTGHEQWTATTGATIGKLVVVVPGLGSIFLMLGNPLVAAVLNGLIASLLALLVMGWRRNRRRQREAGTELAYIELPRADQPERVPVSV